MKRRNLAKLALITALSTSVFFGQLDGVKASSQTNKANLKDEKTEDEIKKLEQEI